MSVLRVLRARHPLKLTRSTASPEKKDMTSRRTDLRWDEGEDEAVEVNQRALIDKILARYSGENTIFRELLQNADDAGAQHVQIKYYTEAGIKQLETAGVEDARIFTTNADGERVIEMPDLKKALMARYVVCNDGIPFRPQDWQRLKKIAEGNPDEEKIGAFGVGFYSLWSVCENPLVESGDKWMGFYWKDGKDQLLARTGALSSPTIPALSTLSGNPWTTFTMDLRSPIEFEAPMDLARFLVTSLTFMRSMRQIEILIDDTTVLSVTKARGIVEKVDIGKLSLTGSSPGGVMTVQGLDATGMVISAKVISYLAASGFTPPPLPPPPIASVSSQAASSFASMLSSALFSRPKPVTVPKPPMPPPSPRKDLTRFIERYMQLKIFQADVGIKVSQDFGRELERATKKAPPKRTSLSLIFSTGKAVLASTDVDEELEATGDDGIFAGLSPRADGESTGRIFIGQATGQTTGIGGHIAARFIPTVERESIDLVDRHVSHWNKELLYVGGYVARAVYELELQDCQRMRDDTEDAKTLVRERASHALQFFTFHASTPSPVVSRDMEAAFFASSTNPNRFPIMSNLGVRPASEVRLPHPILSTFLQGMPTIPEDTLSKSSRMIGRLQERGLLREPSMDDVVKELSARPLNEQEAIDCLKWWLSLSSLKEYSSALRGKLIDAAIFTIHDRTVEKVVPLSVIRTYVNPRTSSIPTDIPLPTHTLPYSISKQLPQEKLNPIFGWVELSLPDLITFLCSPPMSGAAGAEADTDIRVSPVFAERVFSMLARAWPQLSAASTTAIYSTLSGVACVPTKNGMKQPSEAYFDSVKLFSDLAIIVLPKGTIVKGPLEKVFLSLGVRRTVDLQLVFSRLVGGGEWSVADLVKYLVSVQDTLTGEEINKLKKTAAFPLERPGNVSIPAAGRSQARVERRWPSQLYEPTDTLRNLGLPVLDWGLTKWKPSSDEAKLLFAFGLKRHPSVEELLGLAATEGAERQAALRYLLANLDSHYTGFRAVSHGTIAFIPAIKADGTTFLARPGEVFINIQCQVMEFAVIQELLLDNASAQRLGVVADPPTSQLVASLTRNPPSDRSHGVLIFEYMATRVGLASEHDLALLQKSSYIPLAPDNSSSTTNNKLHARPTDVYFATTDTDQSLYKTFFTYVDFGERANNFLRACGVKSEPSIHEVAVLMVREPHKFLDRAGSSEGYQNQLRQIAANYSSLSYATRSAMKSAPFLLASQLVPRTSSSKGTSKEKTSNDDLDTEDMIHVWKLARAGEIAIIDDTSPYHLFGDSVLAAPQETLLEDFYGQLGSKLLSTLVHDDYRVDPPSSSTTPLAVNLKKLVLERLALFMAEPRRKPSDISLETLKKEGQFNVVQVRALKVKRSFKYAGVERSNVQPVSAAASRDRSKFVTLSVSGGLELDYYEIASALVKVLFKQSRPDEPLLLMTILSTPLPALRRRGAVTGVSPAC